MFTSGKVVEWCAPYCLEMPFITLLRVIRKKHLVLNFYCFHWTDWYLDWNWRRLSQWWARDHWTNCSPSWTILPTLSRKHCRDSGAHSPTHWFSSAVTKNGLRSLSYCSPSDFLTVLLWTTDETVCTFYYSVCICPYQFIIDLHSLILVCTNHISLQFHNRNYFIL